MPITQDRMIAVINAGRECLECYKSLIREINESVKRKRLGVPEEQTLEDLLVLAYEFQPSMAAIEVIAVEETHFAAMRHHNEMSRQRMAEQRIQQRGFTQRHPREESVRHRIAERKADLEAGLKPTGAPSFMTPEQFAKFEQELVAEERAKAKAEAEAKAALAPPPNQNPELFRTHDAEAVEIEEVWKAEPGSIIGS